MGKHRKIPRKISGCPGYVCFANPQHNVWLIRIKDMQKSPARSKAPAQAPTVPDDGPYGNSFLIPTETTVHPKLYTKQEAPQQMDGYQQTHNTTEQPFRIRDPA